MSLRNTWTAYRARRSTEGISLREVEVSWLGIKGTWVADRDQQKAAWEMYVELITRISIQPLRSEEGLLREALTSLYTLFAETRRILRTYGPGVATPLREDGVSFGQLAVNVLNLVPRPLLAHWHPRLFEHEQARPAAVSVPAHERTWPSHDELRVEIERVRNQLLTYADLLAAAAGIRSIHADPRRSPLGAAQP